MKEPFLNCFSQPVVSNNISPQCEKFLSLLVLLIGVLVELAFLGSEYLSERTFHIPEDLLFLFFYLISFLFVKVNKPLISAAVSITTLIVILCFHLIEGEIYSLYWFPLIPLLAGMLFEFKLFLTFTYAPVFVISAIFLFQLFTKSYLSLSAETYQTGFNAFSAYLVFSTTAAVYRFFLDKFREKLYYLLENDHLTGVLTRRALFSRLKEISCKELPYSVIMADIDDFKKINDTFGHQSGDRVLEKLGEIFKRNLRKNDLVGRYGGEEFLIVLLNTTGKEASAVAEKLRKTVENSYFDFPGKRLTVSFGVADCSEGENFEKVIELADKRLYKAKELGKNRVVFK